MLIHKGGGKCVALKLCFSDNYEDEEKDLALFAKDQDEMFGTRGWRMLEEICSRFDLDLNMYNCRRSSRRQVARVYRRCGEQNCGGREGSCSVLSRQPSWILQGKM